MSSKNKYEAQIVSTYSRRMLVRTGRNELLTANIQGKLLKPVCGDIVEIEKLLFLFKCIGVKPQ